MTCNLQKLVNLVDSKKNVKLGIQASEKKGPTEIIDMQRLVCLILRFEVQFWRTPECLGTVFTKAPTPRSFRTPALKKSEVWDLF